MSISRRSFNLMMASGATAAMMARPGLAAATDVSFLSFTYAEDPNRPHVQALLDGFKAKSGIAVEPIGSAWGDVQKNVLLRERSRTLPTTAQLSERWLPAMSKLPEVVNLDDAIGRDVLEAAIDPKVLAMGQAGGKTLALPLITGSIGMVANKEVLEKAGVGAPPETLDDFRKVLVAIRDKVPNSVPFAAATKNPNSIPLDFMIMVWAHGGRIITEEGKVVVNSDAAKAALGLMTDFMKDRLIAPELDRPDSRRLFAQGASGFYFDAPQALSFARTLSGRGNQADGMVLPMKTPVLKAGDTAHSIQWGHLVIAFKGAATDGKDAAGIEWLKYLMSDEVQLSFPPSLSALPVTKTAVASPKVQNDPFFKAWANATGVPLTNEVGVWGNAPELSTIISEEVQASLLGQKKPDAAIGSMAERLEASMAKGG
ncbi:ABC transporter substrate-binding protein [Radicibacter daui]|uniref:ABC transporter substrate-binding protein n=1 Tax=Radicibacter daui TaxID=3064829 RepID=UPI004046E322